MWLRPAVPPARCAPGAAPFQERGLRDEARPGGAQILRPDADERASTAEEFDHLDARLRERVERGAEAHRAEGLDPLGMRPSPRNSRAKSVWRSSRVTPRPRRARR